jgi:hypothetical protein
MPGVPCLDKLIGHFAAPRISANYPAGLYSTIFLSTALVKADFPLPAPPPLRRFFRSPGIL